MLYFCLLLLVLLILWFLYDKWYYAAYPPGPLRIPIFGNLLQLSRLSQYPAIAFKSLAQSYGDIVYLRLGCTDTITFNSAETARAIMSHECVKERCQNMLPIMWERMSKKNLGIVFSNGQTWKSLRTFTIRTLRDFGFEKETSMETILNEELNRFTTHVTKLQSSSPDGSVDGDQLFNVAAINIYWGLVTGKRYELDDAKLCHLLLASQKMAESTNFAVDFSIAFPMLYHIFPNWLGKTNQLAQLNTLIEFTRETIVDGRNLGNYQKNPKNLLDKFLAKIDDNLDNPDTEFTDEQLVVILLDLFQAGSDAISNSLGFTTLYMLKYPDIQKEVQAEIDKNVSENETITLSMKNRKETIKRVEWGSMKLEQTINDKLPFTYATLLECLRFSSIVPIPSARQASSDFYFQGYYIKKGMILLSNIQAVHFSKSLWGDPDKFRPERFLTTEGTLDTERASHLLHFGHGSRKCMAVNFSENAVFKYFATLLRNFKLTKPNIGDEPTIVPKLGIVQSPQPYKVIFVPRK